MQNQQYLTVVRDLQSGTVVHVGEKQIEACDLLDIPSHQQCKNEGIQQQDQMADKASIRLQRP